MRVTLRPGTHVLTRPDGDLQVGLDPGSAMVLPGDDGVRETLARLSRPAGPAPADDTTLSLLATHDLLLDERALVAARAAGGAGAALARTHGAAADAVRAARGAAGVEVATFGHACGADLGPRLTALLADAGLPACPDPPGLKRSRREGGSSGRRGRTTGGPPTGACAVLVGVGEPDRERVDDWTRAGTPHLAVRLTEGRAVLGPFVVPGHTACLRCLDGHHSDADPGWPLLVRQYAAASAADRPDGVPEPVDPLLAAQALAWAARDLAAFVDGARPSTWSATVTLGPQPGDVETRCWLRHPACACTWD